MNCKHYDGNKKFSGCPKIKKRIKKKKLRKNPGGTWSVRAQCVLTTRLLYNNVTWLSVARRQLTPGGHDLTSWSHRAHWPPCEVEIHTRNPRDLLMARGTPPCDPHGHDPFEFFIERQPETFLLSAATRYSFSSFILISFFFFLSSFVLYIKFFICEFLPCSCGILRSIEMTISQHLALINAAGLFKCKEKKKGI